MKRKPEAPAAIHWNNNDEDDVGEEEKGSVKAGKGMIKYSRLESARGVAVRLLCIVLSL
jgi:hypothetical protein